MLVASTSRDNTMRFWSMEKYATELKWNVMRHMAAGDFEEAAKSIYFDVENADVPAELKMSGPFVQRLCEMLVDRSVAPVQKWRTVFEVFCVWRWREWLVGTIARITHTPSVAIASDWRVMGHGSCTCPWYADNCAVSQWISVASKVGPT